MVIDFIWLVLIARKFYALQLGDLLKSKVNLAATGLFYLLFVVGLVFLGALLSVVSYATYDLTNLATLKDWPLIVTMVDIIWGAFLGASVSLISYFMASKV